MITVGILPDTYLSTCTVVLSLDVHGMQANIHNLPVAQ